MDSISTIVRPYRWLINLILIAVAAYLLADIANSFIASSIEKVLGDARNAPPPVTQKSEAVLVAMGGNYGSIIQKNIFDPTMGIVVRIPAPVLPPAVVFIPPPPPVIAPPPPPPVIVPPKVPLNVRLIGTVVRVDNPSYAVIQDNRTQKQLIYRVGDFLLEDAKITNIARNRVVVSRGDEEVILEISLDGVPTSRSQFLAGRQPPSQPAPQPVAIPPGPFSPGGIRQVAENHWLMERTEVDHAVNNLPELLTKARVVPNFTDGKADGFRIFAIQEDSLYAKIGLRNGDILKKVNEIDVRNPQNFLQVFQQLKDENRITIELVRNTEDKTFDYTIR